MDTHLVDGALEVRLMVDAHELFGHVQNEGVCTRGEHEHSRLAEGRLQKRMEVSCALQQVTWKHT